MRLALLTALLVTPATHAAEAVTDPTVTPYRPTVSTPAALSAPGWLEVEVGGQVLSVGSSTSRRDSVPYSLKLAFSDDWGIRIGGELLVDVAGTEARHLGAIGDTSFVLKRRVALTQTSAVGLEIGATSPTAPADMHSGSGRTDYGITGIYSADLNQSLHVDINVGAVRLGKAEDHGSPTEAVWAFAVSRSIGTRWGIAGELSGSQQTGADSSRLALLAATYSPGRRATLDLGVARGLATPATGWSIFAGGTFLLTPIL